MLLGSRPARPHLAIALALCAGALSACASTSHHDAAAPSAVADVGEPDRQVVRTGDMTLTVAAPDEAHRAIVHIVEDARGFVERSTSTKDESVWLTCRVPAAELDAVMQRVGDLGAVDRSVVTTLDVTEEVEDLEARLANDIALRDRLRALLDRAKDVDEVLTVERQLTRVQSQIDRMQAKLERLRTQIAHSKLTVALGRGRKLGPIGWVGYGLYWGFEKLFVIQ